MNITKKDESSTNPKLEKINNSESEHLKNSNDKLLDLLSKKNREKSGITSRLSQNNISDII